MFDFLKKKKEGKALIACTDGVLIELEKVNDPVFSEKMMGDGFAIKSKGSVFYSPSDGVISMLFPSNHAYALTLEDGMEILVHIGINTVAEEGKGFKCNLSVGDKVKAGDEIVSIDRPYLEDKGYDLTTMIIFTNKEAYEYFSCEFGREVKGGKDISAYYKA
ncbi:PTS sugar transporter subunit IIA [Clostridium amazonitimonense]|uniref:PTS sugar transporter subunit IIA n=1 Tax=Clostridium amazonitimonense TaxID=1499689 RepID=UPI000509583C|nr:PTS glucose transporter subunit IIA [Clostridium amazonitimonense]